jgi:nucleoside-diphosphate-sugar epimerase
VGTTVVAQILSRFPRAKIRGTYHKTLPAMDNGRVTYVQTDLTTKQGCKDAVRGCDMAIMAAACTGGANAAVAAPAGQMTDNLVMDALMLEAMHQEGIRRIIYLSSATVYQGYDGAIKEKEIDWNQDPYPSYFGVGWAKRSAEKLCEFWHEKYGMRIIILRCANIYGPYAKFNPAASNFIPAIIRKAVSKNDPFEVWGSPHVTRDVIYVDDLAVALVQLLATDDLAWGIFNLGSGESCTVQQVVELSLKFAGHHPSKIVFAEEKPTTIDKRVLDCSKIQQTLNWKPRCSLPQGIEKTLSWWKANKETWNK